jgi:hypothetical protein
MRFAVPVLLLSCASSQVASSVVRSAGATSLPEEAVAVHLTREPVDADELGIVEAHGPRPAATLEQILNEFTRRVAALGGDIARVDAFATGYETVTESYTYECGANVTRDEVRMVTQTNPDGTTTTTWEHEPVTQYESKTCTGDRKVEVATLTIQGRAFRARKGVQ